MAITVKLKHLRIAPRKVRLVADLIRDKTIAQAEKQLEFSVKKAALPIRKLLRSAVATAENDFHKEKDNLFIKEIKVDEGPTLKRARPRARGRVYQILKRTSHVSLLLEEIKPTKKLKTVSQPEAVSIKGPAARVEGKKTEQELEPEAVDKSVSRAGDEARKRARRQEEKTKSRSPLKRIFRRKAF